MKYNAVFFQAAVVSILLYGCTTWTRAKHMEKKLDGNYTRMQQAILNNTSQNSRYTVTNHPSRKLSKLDEPGTRDTVDVRANSSAIYSCGPLHMDEQKHNNQLESIQKISAPIQDIALKTCQER